MTKEGPFVRFTTTKPVSLPSFAGSADLYQDPGISIGDTVSLGNYRLAMESEHLLSQGVVVHPGIIEIPSGWALAAGLGSASSGHLWQVSDVLPFAGA
jgi:hypothetical protein